MFRLAARSVITPVIRRNTPLVATRFPQVSSLQQQQQQQQQRFYAAGALNGEAIKARVLDVLGSFEKVDGTKVTETASFTNDLGLDSLDAVEVVMAIEEEFSIEIPDEDADRITTVGEAIDYISKSPEAR
ncbi:NADH dehydrogenase (ubiquinone) 1 alpha/beta subcomplex 1 [Microbotryum lychnidis-dioicae p1A1 Lamole]|uniref:Acyl carrier protein n=1 Tax=Microbotryum lychnidis-dioicae (strain p1A1 Lamole / MvSl-1064) TaxID=683840 RepID=U5H000_USTV1|nr:NADH dehydrogenase (ubiquinone) 1 alpha/beta subcomplex 1 [Microbotryum lychnidis-dioicae p1A1 Lamole]|eukprot:KDE09022.1 NADH dehydrogenase (ubiquinone) 1 alpha/beta subcomplex 1 [Microbotryum lychnidis-dioicae p1A1 Lamole]